MIRTTAIITYVVLVVSTSVVAVLCVFKMPEYVVVMSLEAGTSARPIYDRLKPLLGLQ